MNLGVTLKQAEKVLGPALPGQGNPDSTLSAIWYSKGKGKKFAGVSGIQEGARFYIHFPVPVDWNLLSTKKGTPDFINDLSESGPQGQQGRERLVQEFLAKQEMVLEKRRLKEEAVEKKKRKEEFASLRPRLSALAGDHLATLTIGEDTFSLPMKITVDKKGKIKVAAAI
jgi:hypothetical protein